MTEELLVTGQSLKAGSVSNSFRFPPPPPFPISTLYAVGFSHRTERKSKSKIKSVKNCDVLWLTGSGGVNKSTLRSIAAYYSYAAWPGQAGSLNHSVSAIPRARELGYG